MKLMPDAYKVVPWRNGQGETTEIAIEPFSASVSDSFLWRISTSYVTESGPFSSYIGYDRILFIIEGECPMHLFHQEQGKQESVQYQRTLLPLQPGPGYQFRGGDSTSSRVDSSVKDLNIFVKSDSVKAEATLYCISNLSSGLSGFTQPSFELSTKGHSDRMCWSFLYCVNAQINVAVLDSSSGQELFNTVLAGQQTLEWKSRGEKLSLKIQRAGISNSNETIYFIYFEIWTIR